MAVSIHRFDNGDAKGSLSNRRCHWQNNFSGRRFALLCASSTPVGSTKLHFAYCDAIAASQLASNTTTMGSTVLSTSTRYFFAAGKAALLATSVLDAKFRRGLRRLVATLHRTPAATSVSRAQAGTSNCRLVAAVGFAPLATAVRRTKEFVTGTLVATGKGTTATTTVSDAKPSGSLGAFGTPLVLTHSISAVTNTVGSPRQGRIVATLNATSLSGLGRSASGCPWCIILNRTRVISSIDCIRILRSKIWKRSGTDIYRVHFVHW
mmetsp:Transcript_5647/g.13481  ORF Transcript_5647/g.13481 Transcript_5647/m.13481 type:complete len:265 (-) Transcript_5647:166-960(-)